MIEAAIVIGSNSTRLLVASLGSIMTPILREREETRLFLGLDNKGCLRPEAMAHTAQVIKNFRLKAVDMGAEKITLLATSATRDAKNSAEFADQILFTSGLKLRVISGEEEARLSFIAVAGKENCVVLDIGGGSTELTSGCMGCVEGAFSAQMGASRLMRMQPIFSIEDAQRARTLAKDALKPQVDALVRCAGGTLKDRKLYGIGGTCTTSISIYLEKESHGEAVNGRIIPYDRALKQLELLAPLSLEEREKVPGLPPGRAPHMPNGLCILLSVMELTGFDQLTVSARTNMDGFLMERCAELKGISL